MQRRQTRTVNNSIDSSIKKPAVSKTMSTMPPGTSTTSNVQKKQTMTTAKKPMKYQVDLRSERNQSVNSNHYKSFDKAK